jgi:hypothetical protein
LITTRRPRRRVITEPGLLFSDLSELRTFIVVPLSAPACSARRSRCNRDRALLISRFHQRRVPSGIPEIPEPRRRANVHRVRGSTWSAASSARFAPEVAPPRSRVARCAVVFVSESSWALAGRPTQRPAGDEVVTFQLDPGGVTGVRARRATPEPPSRPGRQVSIACSVDCMHKCLLSLELLGSGRNLVELRRLFDRNSSRSQHVPRCLTVQVVRVERCCPSGC